VSLLRSLKCEIQVAPRDIISTRNAGPALQHLSGDCHE
jgi:hypothetical protein